MSTLFDKVRAFSDEHQLFAKGSHVIAGLSGGPDSVALLSLLKKLQPFYGYKLIAAHLDHQWRTGSHKDAEFSRRLAQSLGIEFESTTAETISLTKKPRSQEDHGRLLRRAYFEQLAEKYNASAIVLGHHYNDQQETFFLRMIRGASISGLSAMKPKSGLYVRPLLSCTKDELLAYLKQEDLSYQEDATNTDPKYLRNAIRHSVIPALRECDTRFDRSFLKTLTSVQKTNAYLDRVTEDTFQEITTVVQGATLLNTEKFFAVDEFLQDRLLVRWFCTEGVPFTPSTAFFNELKRFMSNSAKEHQMHPLWRIKKDKQQMKLVQARG